MRKTLKPTLNGRNMTPARRHTVRRMLLAVALGAMQLTSAAADDGADIIVDQFGYRPEARKVAVVRLPYQSPDPHQLPAQTYHVVNSLTGQTVLTAMTDSTRDGQADVPSGDRVWWVDFTELTAPGTYYITDEQHRTRSYDFRVSADVYADVLCQATRMFFYQRAGCEKAARHAGEGWSDAASHLRPGQDLNARQGNRRDDATTERDVHGGWYDAGDYNKYTPWTCDYIEQMLLAYEEHPSAFADDSNIPESGNGLPDILDEAKWGLDYLLRLQNADGSVLSIVNLDHASPPSAATGPSYYGPASTTSTLAATKSLALSAVVFGQTALHNYADSLRQAALMAWQWASQHPDSLFFTKAPDSGMGGAEVDTQNPTDRFLNVAAAGMALYELTGQQAYLAPFEQGYTTLPLMAGQRLDQYQFRSQQLCLRYLRQPDANTAIAADIRQSLQEALRRLMPLLRGDGYRSFIPDYNWGSNQYKCNYGMLLWLLADALQADDALRGQLKEMAEDYVHYIHGMNPLATVYLTNMDGHGASHSLTEMYHAWFCDGSPLWDKVGQSTYGPPPGYLVGGPYQHFRTEQSPEALSQARQMGLPDGLPPARMYADYNTSWPLNSWQLSEPSGAYQVAYIRLLSKFVNL